MRENIGILILLAGAFLLGATSDEAKRDLTEFRLRTVYDTAGRPLDQSETNKGFHVVMGSTILSNGRDTIIINEGTVDGRQDVTFISARSYYGRAWSLSEADTNSYRVIPLSGSRFVIVSSDTLDTDTVNFFLQGQ